MTSPQHVAIRALGPNMDRNKLLLLGLNLLNKSMKLPCAVVKPQTKIPTSSGTSQLAEKLKSSPSLPYSPTEEDTEISRKRKRDPSDDENLSELGKREKRFANFVLAYLLV